MKTGQLIHLLDRRWESAAARQYRQAYALLKSLFCRKLDEAFFAHYWVPDPVVREYLVRLLIRFVPMSVDTETLAVALQLRNMSLDNPLAEIRMQENAGEFVLWYSGLFRRPVFQREGRYAYQEAYERLREIELEPSLVIWLPNAEPAIESDRLRVDRLLSTQFENYREVLERTDLISDPEYTHLRSRILFHNLGHN